MEKFRAKKQWISTRLGGQDKAGFPASGTSFLSFCLHIVLGRSPTLRRDEQAALFPIIILFQHSKRRRLLSAEIRDGRIFAGAAVSKLHHADCTSALAICLSTFNRRLMARNEDDFRIRPGKVRDRGGGQEAGRRIGAARGRPTSFVGEVQRAIRRAGGNLNRDFGTGKGGGRFNARGRGAATAQALRARP
jgi:hypothetical protein